MSNTAAVAALASPANYSIGASVASTTMLATLAGIEYLAYGAKANRPGGVRSQSASIK